MEQSVLSYEKRIYYIDTILNYVSKDKKTKFYILSCIHYTLFALLDSILLFSNSFHIVYILYIFLILQIILNHIDNGCFLMKLERKYIGKEWIGPYTYIDTIFGEGYMNVSKVSTLFYSISNIFLCIGIVKLWYLTFY